MPMRICISLLFLVILACIVPASALLPSPVANFTVDSSTGYALNPIHFTDTSTGKPDSWYWSFGDGESSTLQNPEHSYTSLSGGVYTVSLKVTNAAGSNTSALKNIYMADYTQVPTTIAAQQITAPTRAVSNQISPTPGVQKPVTTPKTASLPFSLAILAIMFGALVACLRR